MRTPAPAKWQQFASDVLSSPQASSAGYWAQCMPFYRWVKTIQGKAETDPRSRYAIPAVPWSSPFCCLLTAAAVTVLSSLALLLPHATYTRMCGQASSHIHAEYLWIGWKHVIDVIANLWFIINWRDSRSAICLKCAVMPTDSDVYRIRTIKVPFIKYSALLLSIMQIQIHSWQSKTRSNLT